MAERNRTYNRILEIGPIPPPRAGWGVRIEYVLQGLREAGVECAALDLGENRRVRRPECEDVQSGWDFMRKVWRYLAKGYRLHTHLNACSMKAYVLVLYATILSWLFRRPPVLTWHGGTGHGWFPIQNGNLLVNQIHRIIFHLSEWIICNDEKIARHLADYGISMKKIIPIPAFSVEYLKYTPTEVPANVREFVESHSPLAFCYLMYRPEFYLPELAEGLRLLRERYPEFGIILVGSIAGYEKFEQELTARGLGSETALALGDVSHDTFLTLIQLCDVYIRTPNRDGIASSVLESLAYGVPVVAAANALRPPQVHTYQAEDPVDMARAVTQLMELPREERRPEPPDIPDTVQREVAVLTNCRECPEAALSGV